MKHIRKFNEDIEMEFSEFEFKLINIESDEVEGEIKIGHSFGKLPDGSELKEGYR